MRDRQLIWQFTRHGLLGESGRPLFALMIERTGRIVEAYADPGYVAVVDNPGDCIGLNILEFRPDPDRCMSTIERCFNKQSAQLDTYPVSYQGKHGTRVGLYLPTTVKTATIYQLAR